MRFETTVRGYASDVELTATFGPPPVLLVEFHSGGPPERGLLEHSEIMALVREARDRSRARDDREREQRTK